ncbi:MAG: master DNA invertase Mpi family serine-type recombinase [Paludibacteraceae bacterium]|nr:master DNA invertase Mpi family serine-type recombinase [Paludibacteraceae bacterium]
MNYGYIRVSSDKQTVENQRFEITRFCEKEGLAIDGWIEETVSGTCMYSKRRLGKLLRKVRRDDLIVCSELSRLGRSLYMIMEILSLCLNRGCRVWTIKDGYRLGSDIQSKVLAFAFGLSAEIERDLISQRTREALARLRAEGKRIGRVQGSRNSQESCILFKHDRYIRRHLKMGTSQHEISRRLHCDRGTLRLYIRRYILMTDPIPKLMDEVLTDDEMLPGNGELRNGGDETAPDAPSAE